MMRSEPTVLFDVKIIHLDVHEDNRGGFVNTFEAGLFEELGLESSYFQDSSSINLKAGTVRGLHFQFPKYSQSKIIKVDRGSIFDVIVDVRVGSPTYANHAGIVLTENDWKMVYIPEGFAHGFCSLTDNAVVAYKLSTAYAPNSSGGIFWNDPSLNIDWPIEPHQAIISENDKRLPLLKDCPNEHLHHYKPK